LHSESESWNLPAIGATKRTYSRPTSGSDGDFSKCKQCLFAWYCAPSTLQILSNATLTLMVVCDVTFVYFKLYFYSIKITLATGRLTNVDKLTFD